MRFYQNKVSVCSSTLVEHYIFGNGFRYSLFVRLVCLILRSKAYAPAWSQDTAVTCASYYLPGTESADGCHVDKVTKTLCAILLQRNDSNDLFPYSHMQLVQHFLIVYQTYFMF